MVLKVGDKVIICRKERWIPGLPDMRHGTVVDVNTSSTYVKFESGYTIRFKNRKSKMTTTDFNTQFTILESEEEFNQMISDILERTDLIAKINGKLSSASLDDLREISKILKVEVSE